MRLNIECVNVALHHFSQRGIYHTVSPRSISSRRTAARQGNAQCSGLDTVRERSLPPLSHQTASPRRIVGLCPPPRGSCGQHLPERLYGELCKYPGSCIRIGIRPLLRRLQRGKFGDDQAAGETRHTRIDGINRRKRACQQQPAFILQSLQTRQMIRACHHAFSQAVRSIQPDDRV